MTSPTPLLFDEYYHIYNRGVNRENIFVEERNYDHFMRLYVKHLLPVVDTFAYCLLRNHFHLLVKVKSEQEIRKTLKDLKTPLASDTPSKKFSDFFNAYAKAINRAYGRTGSLFQHPFGRVLIRSEGQLWNVIAYIHQNPQKHGFVKDFRDWSYSSYHLILSDKPTTLRRDVVVEWFGGEQAYQKLNSQWVSDTESTRYAQDDFD